MGTGIPEAIGASISSGKAETYCIIGDGSMMFNMQELQTVKHHNLPIKIIIYNNLGYLAIKHTQQSFLDKSFMEQISIMDCPCLISFALSQNVLISHSKGFEV